MEETKIVDIYEGEYISIWKDEETISISFPFCVVIIPIEDWESVKKEISEIAEL